MMKRKISSIFSFRATLVLLAVLLTTATATAQEQTSADLQPVGNTYYINSAENWETFCNMLVNNPKGIFTGKTVKLDDDITVSSMAGNVNFDFTGTFDGQGHTLTFNATAADNYCAPFRYVQGTAENHAVIKNLNVKSTITGTGFRHLAGLIAMQSGYVEATGCNVEVNISCMKGSNNTTLYPAAIVSQANNTSELTISGCTATGTIATDGQYAAGILGIVQKAATIQNCLSSVTISSSTSGDGTHGGLVAAQPSNTSITIEGCVFNGKLLGEQTNACGGFVGYRNGSASITNSIFAPAEVTVSTEGSATFARNWDGTLENCYYTQPFGTVQGKQMRAITVSGNVTATITPTGTSTAYNVSGITAYSGGGLMYGGTCYCGSDDQVNITLSPQSAGYNIIGCTATPEGATLTALGNNSYTLTMPDTDVAIDVAVVTSPEGDGTADNPYIVRDWSTFCSWVAGLYDITKNKHFKLAADLTATTMAGTAAQPFCGTFDGDGHTLTLSFGSAEQPFNEMYCAPFRYVGYATIKNLHVDGAITTSDSFAAGFVGVNVKEADGPLTIENCRSSVTITNNTSTGDSGGAFIAGFIGQNQRTIENQSIINHCVFDGKLLAPNAIGVAGFFFGQKYTYNYTYHSFFAPVETQRDPNNYSYCVNFGTRCPSTAACYQDLKDCYYTQVLGDLRWQSTYPGSPGVLLYNSGVPATANDGVISRVDGQTFDTKLLDRTLYKDGSWNTLCLPFGLDDFTGTPLEGATVMELSSSRYEAGELTLNFTNATSIVAGKPYIVKWDKPEPYTPYDGTNAETCSDVVDPVFTGCVISESTGGKVTATDRVDFVGSFAPVPLEADDKSVLYLTADNTLCYPNAAMTVGSCRAIFQLKGITAGDLPANGVKLFFGDEATAVTTPIAQGREAAAWYTLDGRRLNGKPAQRGVYIKDGKKEAIK